mgnify:CR=1 FL=1
MKISLVKGITFGLTSGIITTLGLIVGLSSGTHSKSVVIGGILTIAIADSLSDALGVHISEESENKHTDREIWESTISTFLTKFLFALTFIIPVLSFNLDTAIILSVIWGMIVLISISYFMAKSSNEPCLRVILEHVIIAIIVITLTHFSGKWINKLF